MIEIARLNLGHNQNHCSTLLHTVGYEKYTCTPWVLVMTQFLTLMVHTYSKLKRHLRRISASVSQMKRY